MDKVHSNIFNKANQFCKEILDLVKQKGVHCSIKETELSTNIFIGLESNVDNIPSFTIIKSKQICKKQSKNLVNKISRNLVKKPTKNENIIGEFDEEEHNDEAVININYVNNDIKQNDIISETFDKDILNITSLNQKLTVQKEILDSLSKSNNSILKKKSSSSEQYQEHSNKIEKILNDSTVLLNQYLSQQNTPLCRAKDNNQPINKNKKDDKT